MIEKSERPTKTNRFYHSELIATFQNRQANSHDKEQGYHLLVLYLPSHVVGHVLIVEDVHVDVAGYLELSDLWDFLFLS